MLGVLLCPWEDRGLLGHRVSGPSPHLHLCQVGNFPHFSISKQPNFLQGDLRPHPGWGDRSSCEVTPQGSAPHCWVGDKPHCGGSAGLGAAGVGSTPTLRCIACPRKDRNCQAGTPREGPQGGGGCQ